MPAAPAGGERRARKRSRALRIALAAVLVIAVLSAFALYLAYKRLVAWTEEVPSEVPVVEIPEPDRRSLEERLERWVREAPGAEGRLVLSARELNALIAGARDPDLERLRGRLYIRIEGGQVSLDLSVPLEGAPLLGGRYFNGTIAVRPQVRKGRLHLEFLSGITRRGDVLPGTVLETLERGLARAFENSEELASFELQSVEVTGDTLVLVR